MGTLSVDKLVKTSAGAAEFTLPATDGTAGQVWQTDGAGQLSVAALAADTVGTSQISALAVDTAEIAANAVDGSKIAMGSDAAGDVLYYNGTDYVRLGAGTANQTLQMNAGATAPAWVTVAAAGGENTPSFAAYNAAGHALTSGAYTQIQADTELYDVGGCYDPTTYSFTVPAGEGGNYVIWVNADFDNGSTANITSLGIYLYLDGVSTFRISYVNHTSNAASDVTNAESMSLYTVATLVAGEEVEWYMWSVAASGTTSINAGPRANMWGAYKLIGV